MLVLLHSALKKKQFNYYCDTLGLSFVRLADVEASQRFRSSSSSSMIVSRTRLPNVGDRAFPVAAARIWNSLLDLVTSAPSVAVFRSRLKTHLFPTPVIVQCLSSDSSCFGHYNRSCKTSPVRVAGSTGFSICTVTSCDYSEHTTAEQRTLKQHKIRDSLARNLQQVQYNLKHTQTI